MRICLSASGCVFEFGVWTSVYIGACVCMWSSCSRCKRTVLVTVTPLFSRGWWTLERQPPIIVFTLMREAFPPLHGSQSLPLFLSISLSFMFLLFLTVYLSVRKKRSIINCLYFWSRFTFFFYPHKHILSTFIITSTTICFFSLFWCYTNATTLKSLNYWHTVCLKIVHHFGKYAYFISGGE